MSDLKSCPFCGSAKIEFRDIAQQTLVAIYYNCNAEDSYNTIEHASTSREQAVAAWNRRASPEIGERAEREAVARIIDPELFKRSEAHLAACAGHGMTDDEARRTFGHESYMLQINAVLAKADAIIALSAPSPSADALRPGEAMSRGALVRALGRAKAGQSDVLSCLLWAFENYGRLAPPKEGFTTYPDPELTTGEALLCLADAAAAFFGFETTNPAESGADADEGRAGNLPPDEPTPSTPPFIQWNGGENPAPGKRVDVKFRVGECGMDGEAAG